MPDRFPRLFPESASSLSGATDEFYLFMWAVTLVFSMGIGLALLVFGVKYRRRHRDERPPEIHPSMLLEVAWSVIPFLLTVVMFVWAAWLFFAQARVPDDAIRINVVGKRWMWKLQHMTGQREINELHVPLGKPVRLVLTSEDVIHSFFVPAFRIKKDAVPGRYNDAWFTATKPGRYRIYCTEYCGTEHSRMVGWVNVLGPTEYQQWLAGGPAPVSPVAAGQRLFTERNCSTCHYGDSGARGPVLNGLPGSKVLVQGGASVTADDTYLRESILAPAAKVVAGYQPIMPTFAGQLGEEDIAALIAYIKSLPPAAGDAAGRKASVPQSEPRP
jgi:cytochrome c oxidase subunit 2